MIHLLPSPANLPVALLKPSSAREWRLRWNWDWPLWLSILVIAAAAVWVMAIYSRENSTAGRRMRSLLGLLRLTALALVLLMFAQPAIEWFRLGRPRLVVLIDKSASMQTLDRDPQSNTDVSRIDAWRELLTGGEHPLLEQWQSDYQLDVVTFGEKITPIVAADDSVVQQLKSIDHDETESNETRLGDAIDFALRELPGTPPVAIVLLSDGIRTTGQTLQQAAEQARRIRVPLYPVAIGSELRSPDIAVENLIVEEIVFPGDRLRVEATVRATGFEGKSVEVILRGADSETLALTTISLPSDRVAETISLAIRPSSAGPMPLELSIDPQEDERNTENNRTQQVVEVRDEKIRVLLVQSQPSYEYRALKSLLERDPAVELNVLLQEADADYAMVDDAALRGFPVGERALFSYDVIILGDVDLGLLPRSVWPLVERFVTQHGGGVVGIAGPRFMPFAYRGVDSLAALLPMELEAFNSLRSQLGGINSFAVNPTALGWRFPSLQLGDTMEESRRIWQSLPPLTWLVQLDNIKPGAQVLAECAGVTNRQGQPMPVILRHYVGAGEVLFHATDETWRWRWRTDDRYFARYWGQVVRRLGRGRLATGRQGVTLTTDRAIYEPGEVVQLMARFRNPTSAPAASDGVIVQLQEKIGPPKQIDLSRRLGRRGIFTASVDELVPGEYEALIIRPDRAGANDVARFEIRQPHRELATVALNRVGLQAAAELSGGKYFEIADVSRLTKALPPPRQQTIDEVPPRQLWNSHGIVALLVLVLTSEWLLRRRYGML